MKWPGQPSSFECATGVGVIESWRLKNDSAELWDNDRWGLWTWSRDCLTLHPAACSKSNVQVQARTGGASEQCQDLLAFSL